MKWEHFNDLRLYRLETPDGNILWRSYSGHITVEYCNPPLELTRQTLADITDITPPKETEKKKGKKK